MAQLASPDADVVNQGYTGEDADVTDIFAHIDEAIANDNDYIQSGTAPSSDVYTCHLSDVTDPVSSSDHVIRYRYRKSATSGSQIDLTVQLRQGYVNEGALGTLIKQWTHSDISASPTGASNTLSGGEADAITDYTDLFLRFSFNQP
jgi:hypothetical protein